MLDNLIIPEFSYKVFNNEDLLYEPEEQKGDILRYDNINLTRLSYEEKNKLLIDLRDQYAKVAEQGFEYKDHILNRYFFKEFVIKEKVDKGITDPYSNKKSHLHYPGYEEFMEDYQDQTRFFKYSLSNWKESSKIKHIDDRILTVDVYTEYKFNFNFAASSHFERDFSFKIKVAHKDDIASIADQIMERTDNPNLYVLPIYLTNGNDKYVRISDYKNDYKRNYYNIYDIIDFIYHSLIRFMLFNLYLLNKVEENEEFSFKNDNDIVSADLVSYIKKNPKTDKKIIIRDDKGIMIKIDPKEKNIYDHSNTLVRTLCDYKYQVHGHYRHQWYGSRKNNTRHTELIWIESYEKNPSNRYRIIKERML